MFSGLDAAQNPTRRWTAMVSFTLQAALLAAALIVPLLNPHGLPEAFIRRLYLYSHVERRFTHSSKSQHCSISWSRAPSAAARKQFAFFVSPDSESECRDRFAAGTQHSGRHRNWR